MGNKRCGDLNKSKDVFASKDEFEGMKIVK